MGTRIEQYDIIHDGLVKDAEYTPVVVRDEVIFYPDAIIDDRECCVEISDEKGKTTYRVIEDDIEVEGVELTVPNSYFDIPIGDCQELGPTKVVRVIHTDNIIYQQPQYSFSLN